MKKRWKKKKKVNNIFGLMKLDSCLATSLNSVDKSWTAPLNSAVNVLIILS